jgi:hypothetical protein
MTSLLVLRFWRYLLIPVLILVYMLGVGLAGYRWGRAGAELAHAEAQLDLNRKIRRADERIERESPGQASIDTLLKRLDRYAVDREF